jgi:alpha/beta superfamily hydrolase
MSGGAGFARVQTFLIEGPAGPIEALLQERTEHDHALTAVVCHPHPLFGGTMHNKVVYRVASTLHGLGAAVVRFNFRGVGRSAGTHDRGEGELADARAVLAFLRERYPDARRWVAGFSFGSWVASRLAASEPDAERLILVAPPVHTQTFEEMRTSPVPKLVIQGTADVTCKPENLYALWPQWSEPKRLMKVEGATHFFDRHLNDLAEAVLQGIR